MTCPATAVLPIPIPVSCTPLAAPYRRSASSVRRSTLMVVRSWARRPISLPTGSSRRALRRDRWGRQVDQWTVTAGGQ